MAIINYANPNANPPVPIGNNSWVPNDPMGPTGPFIPDKVGTGATLPNSELPNPEGLTGPLIPSSDFSPAGGGTKDNPTPIPSNPLPYRPPNPGDTRSTHQRHLDHLKHKDHLVSAANRMLRGKGSGGNIPMQPVSNIPMPNLGAVVNSGY